jgi:tRNA threonylcarbamoyl adenosine modification protein YjeE
MSATERRLENPRATERAAAQLARVALPGDCITLEGPLGAGKTVFARAFIRALCGEETEVTSPTFTLVQRYDAMLADGYIVPLWHADLYRLHAPGELRELGLDDMLDGCITLIEWPQIAAASLPPDRLALTLEPGKDPHSRTLHCAVPPAWAHRLPWSEA